MDAPDLSEILERARKGDSAAVEALYRRFARPVYGMCRNLLGSKEAAEDATQEVFMKMQRGVAGYNGSIPFLNWLFSVTSHHCIDLLRKRSREQGWVTGDELPLERASNPMASPLTEVLVKDKGAHVREAMAQLPVKYRVPLTLQYFGDLKYDEIAERLHLNRNTVATLIFRAKQELRVLLGREKDGAVR